MMRLEEDTDREVDLNAAPDLRVHCSICLEFVETDGRRSTAKLQCGHEFHLDCIGSAFNAKGIMQCPNCRNIEKGQWLYAIGSANVASGIGLDSWIAEQYPFFLVPYGFRICPFRGYMDDPSGHAFYGHHDSFGEQIPPSSPGFAYFAYFRPPPPHASPLNPNEHMDAPNFAPLDENRQNEIFASHTSFPWIDVNYPPWRHHFSSSSPPTGSHMIETSHHNLRSRTGAELDAATGSRFPGHYFSSTQRPSTGTGTSAMVAHHPFGRRSSNGFPAYIPAGRPPYDPRSWFYYPPYLSSVPNYFNPWGRGGLHFPVLPSSDQWLRHR